MSAVTYRSSAPLHVDGNQVDNLVAYTMDMFDKAELDVHPMRVAKVAKKALREHGYSVARLIMRQYFESAESVAWESYARALAGADARRMVHTPGDVR